MLSTTYNLKKYVCHIEKKMLLATPFNPFTIRHPPSHHRHELLTVAATQGTVYARFGSDSHFTAPELLTLTNLY